MIFNSIIFATALYALTAETVEDAFVLAIFKIIYGRKSVIFGLVAASVITVLFFITLVYIKIPEFEIYSEYVIIGSGIFLLCIGSYWIIRYILMKKKLLKDESREKSPLHNSFFSFILVLVELLEILAILIPFTLANYVTETILAAGLSVLISIAFTIVIGKTIRSRLENRLNEIKLFAGIALLVSGTMIILNIR